jgi:hypothetical protein
MSNVEDLLGNAVFLLKIVMTERFKGARGVNLPSAPSGNRDSGRQERRFPHISKIGNHYGRIGKLRRT